MNPTKIVKREYVYDGDRWIVPGTHNTYLLRTWRVDTQHTGGALYFIHGRYGRPQLIRKWYAGMIADEIKWRIKSKGIRLIYRPAHERRRGVPIALLWHENEI